MPRLTEDELIARFFAPLAGFAGLGLADDAACLAPPPGHELVLTTDMLVAGVHFFADDPAESIARKALRVNLSDLAAKAAEPLGFLLSLALQQDWTETWLAGFTAGLADDAKTYGCPLLGGDTVKIAGPLVLSITAVGAVPQGTMVPRPGVADGDVLYVTGTIGDAALGLRLWGAESAERARIDRLGAAACAHLRRRYLLPLPRLGMRQALRAHAHAAMDVSDGLAGDLAKMLRLTGMSAEIACADVPLSEAARAALADDPALIVPILSGGDDYEILCAVAPAAAAAFETAAGAGGVTVTAIGRACRGAEAPVFTTAAGPVALPFLSYQHF